MSNNHENNSQMIKDKIFGDIATIDPRKDKPEIPLVVPTIPDLLKLSNSIKTIFFMFDKTQYEVKIRALPYGKLQDIGHAGKTDIRVYRTQTVLAGLVDPAPASIEEVSAMPYGFVVTVAIEIEEYSKATTVYQKKR